MSNGQEAVLSDGGRFGEVHHRGKENRLGSLTDTCQPNDPFNLRRFTKEQAFRYQKALAEIRRGRKTSCWMWFIIPTPPYYINGVEMGSALNKKYALRSESEAMAYLVFCADGVDLGRNYFEILGAVRDQLRTGKTATDLLGEVDEPKLVSSVRFFDKLGRCSGDTSLSKLCSEVLTVMRKSTCPREEPLFPDPTSTTPKGRRTVACSSRHRASTITPCSGTRRTMATGGNGRVGPNSGHASCMFSKRRDAGRPMSNGSFRGGAAAQGGAVQRQRNGQETSDDVCVQWGRRCQTSSQRPAAEALIKDDGCARSNAATSPPRQFARKRFVALAAAAQGDTSHGTAINRHCASEGVGAPLSSAATAAVAARSLRETETGTWCSSGGEYRLQSALASQPLSVAAAASAAVRSSRERGGVYSERR